MAKQTKTSAGSGGLVSGKKMNMKVAVLIVIAVSIAGGLSVFLSHAGTSNSFVRTASQMRGGYQNKLYANGTRSATSPIEALVLKKEMTNTKKVCVHYTVQTPSPDGGLGFSVQIRTKRTDGRTGDEAKVQRTFSISGKPKGYSEYACINNSTLIYNTGSAPTLARVAEDSIINVEMLGRGGILVDKVEGRPE